MTFSAPMPLQASHRLEGFDCGRPTLNDWLIRHARQAQASGSAKTFVVQDATGVAGYFSLTVGKIYPIPVVILARLAVAQRVQGCGLGVGMLQDAIRRTVLIAEQAGIRALLTHPLDDAATAFYQRFGFQASPLRPDQLLLLLKDARLFI